ncbi:MAG: hypothetical protein GF313_01450 [Caldithrix sp.]|nr:hypothetical protein [Caldithrix sp.]
MLALILTIACSTSIALILKSNAVNKGNALILLMGNYLMAAIIGFIFVVFSPKATCSVPTLIFGALLAFMFVFAFFAFAKAVHAAGTALSTVSARLSVVVPIVLSIIIYHELPNEWQLGGFFFTIVTIIAFYFSLKRLRSAEPLSIMDYFFLFAVLAGIGFNDFCMKVFQHWRPLSEKALFLFTIFLFAFIYSAAYVRIKRIPLEQKTLIRGSVLGIPNIFSSYFLLAALDQLPAIVVYPVINIGIILLTTLLAALIWKERLNSAGIVALITGTTAIVLLSL